MKRFLIICFTLLMSASISMAATSSAVKKNTTTTVFVTDIACHNCVQKIMNNVPSLGKGIEDVQVDLKTKEVTVVYDASKNDDAGIVKGFAKLKIKAEVKKTPASK